MRCGRAWRAAALLAVSLPACHRAAPLRFADAPVVLISIDTLRSDHLPAYGYTQVDTPALDRLRREAVLFRHAYSPCPMTLPAHLTMLTGLLPPRHEVRSNAGFVFRADRHSSLPAQLRAHGYATGAAVSSFVLRGETGLAGLFDDYDDAIDPRPGAAFADYQRRGDAAVDSARRWIDGHAGRPFFYFLHLYEPHVPYDPPEPFRSRYASPYDGEIAAADALVGELLDHLRTRGLFDRSLVIVTSDHGEGLGDHGEEQHSILLYREALQVPLLLKLPGSARAGTVVEVPAQLADLAPTVMDLLGLAPGGTGPDRPDGVPLLSLEQAPPRTLYGETLYPRLHLGWSDLHSLVGERWHYIHGPRPELYDLVADPGERHDLAAAEPEVVRAMARELERWPADVPRPQAVDPATAERLGALGYVAGARAAPAGPLPNPRDQMDVLRRLGEAVRLTGEKRFETALVRLHTLLADNPGLVEGWIRLGDLLGQMGRFAEAKSAYDQALARAPLSADVVLARGQVQLKAGRWEAAAADAERARAELPVQSAELRARIALGRNQPGVARQEAEAALRLRQPPPPSAYLLLAEVRARTGDLVGALTTLDEAERRAEAARLPRPYGLDFLRADTLARLNRPAEAEAAYRREIASYPAHTQAYANLAVLCFVQGRQDEGQTVLGAMVRQNPDAPAYRLAAATLEALGDKAGAAALRRRTPGS